MKPQKPLLLFFRKFLPMCRRALFLFFSGGSKPSFELFHVKKSEGKLINTSVSLKVKHGLILQVNGHSMPIYSDNQILTLKVPNSSSELEIKVRGLFSSERRIINVQESSVRLNSPNLKSVIDAMDVQIVRRNPQINARNISIQPSKTKIKTPRLSLNSGFSLNRMNDAVLIKQSEPKPINNLSIKEVSDELEATLTTNQVLYEK